MVQEFNARDFKEFIRVAAITYVRTSPHYPLSNGKLEQMLRAWSDQLVRRLPCAYFIASR